MELSEIGIRNFFKVDEHLYRGGQPTKEELTALSRAGITTVVSLRQRRGITEKEKKFARELGLGFFNIPLNYWTFPSVRDIRQFLEIVETTENRPVFVHCFHGADRTGIAVAVYRIARCGWSFEMAYEEMVDCGFHRIRVHHYKYALKHLSSRAKEFYS